jgi:hypothetical protein
VVAALLLALATTASAASFDKPVNPAPSWFTQDFKQKVDAAGHEGVPLDGPTALDVCPGVVAFHEGGVGTGTCLVYPFGCTANFIYQSGSGTSPAVSNGNQYLGTAGHCTEKVGEPVYGAISTPGVGPSIARIGTVSKRIEDYDGSQVFDFTSIKIDPGYQLYPASPVGGPQGVYDGCQVGTPLKYYGHGYEIAVAQGKPEGGVSTHWYDDGYGWEGPAFGGDSGSGVLTADGKAAGNLDAIIILSPPYLPGEIVGSRMTWILSWSGLSLVNADFTTSRDTDSACGTEPGSNPLNTLNGGGKPPGKGGGGNGKGGKPKL